MFYATSSARVKGFTLIEVVVSVFVIGASVALFSTALLMTRVVRDARLQEEALRIASTELEKIRALPYDELPATGPFSNKRIEGLPAGTGALSVTDYSESTKSIEVVVSWFQASSTRSVSVTTLKTEVGGL